MEREPLFDILGHYMLDALDRDPGDQGPLSLEAALALGVQCFGLGLALSQHHPPVAAAMYVHYQAFLQQSTEESLATVRQRERQETEAIIAQWRSASD